MAYLAHSARPERGIPPQEYGRHIRASRMLAQRYARQCGKFSERFGTMLEAVAALAGEFHDLGKLDEANQRVLAAVNNGKQPLPVPHVDAGAAHLLGQGEQASLYAALICYAHHQGLPSIRHEKNMRPPNCFLRYEHKESSELGAKWRAHTDSSLSEYLSRHRECVPETNLPKPEGLNSSQTHLLWRLALSCQADADHGDTARHYGELPLRAAPSLKAKERLAALDAYVTCLSEDNADASRTQLRQEIYKACRGADTLPRFRACDSPVGTGKTTAVMAHLLRAACDKGLRQIFVVLPYTNIITQAVEVYREALVLSGEDPELIVAEHHHRAEYDAPDTRHFAMLWNAPIVVTTAVQFFETLAANMPAALRKLHRLPGSAVFIDEAHAALPAHLWPQAWLWLNQLSVDWGCHFVFASGSLTRFWELPDFHPEKSAEEANPPRLQELVGDEGRSYAHSREEARIVYKTEPQPFGLEALAKWIAKFDGPRLIVMNTVQSAAAVAREIANRAGCARVEHLSTALTPADRKIILNRVKQRIKESSDPNWTLVATSCVEAGVDFSFRVGFRERASLMSLIQLGGRVNREHSVDSAEVWDFQIIPDKLLRFHPRFKTAARMLGQMFDENKIGPSFCKEALRREIRWDKVLKNDLIKAESGSDARAADFAEVAKLFKVIDSNTVSVVVALDLQKRLRDGRWCGREALQKHSVQIWGWRVEELRLPEFPQFPGLYGWPYDYDLFLGYMAGLLPVIEFAEGKPTVI